MSSSEVRRFITSNLGMHIMPNPLRDTALEVGTSVFDKVRGAVLGAAALVSARITAFRRDPNDNIDLSPGQIALARRLAVDGAFLDPATVAANPNLARVYSATAEEHKPGLRHLLAEAAVVILGLVPHKVAPQAQRQAPNGVLPMTVPARLLSPNVARKANAAIGTLIHDNPDIISGLKEVAQVVTASPSVAVNTNYRQPQRVDDTVKAQAANADVGIAEDARSAPAANNRPRSAVGADTRVLRATSKSANRQGDMSESPQGELGGINKKVARMIEMQAEMETREKNRELHAAVRRLGSSMSKPGGTLHQVALSQLQSAIRDSAREARLGANSRSSGSPSARVGGRHPTARIR